MDQHLTFTLRPDPELPASVLMNSLFSKLHRQLVAHAGWQIGISFPGLPQSSDTAKESPKGLGLKLRLHGNQDDLSALAQLDWLGGLAGYVANRGVQAVPATQHTVIVRRVQAKSSPARLAERFQRRHQKTKSEVHVYYESMKAQRLDLPYLNIRSQSTEQQFKLFVSQSTSSAPPISGTFNRYGISQIATLPWF